MNQTKYIKDKTNRIIVFSDLYQHSNFKWLEPKSAGFISFGINVFGNHKCECYGESISLNLKSEPKEDTRLAMRQILNYEPFDVDDNLDS